jgi:hypothetical protein
MSAVILGTSDPIRLTSAAMVSKGCPGPPCSRLAGCSLRGRRADTGEAPASKRVRRSFRGGEIAWRRGASAGAAGSMG